MEKHKCKLCNRSFANGKALGGHMRSHMLNLYVPPKTEQPSEQLREESESAQSSEEENGDKGLFGYGLRDNPKRSIRLVDPEFSFSAAGDGAGAAGGSGGGGASSSVVLQDRESETESSKNHPVLRRRSKRIQKFHDHDISEESKKPNLNFANFGKRGAEISSYMEIEPVSSISDTTPEEDVAHCLMMMSKDKWKRQKINEDGEEEQINIYVSLSYHEDEDDSDPEEVIKVTKSASRTRGKYKCETCNKVFRSYQALGGHRASHKKVNMMNPHEFQGMAETGENAGGPTMVETEKIHECPFCSRVFSSGQALGGHKRTHGIGSSSSAAVVATSNHHKINSVNEYTKHGVESSFIDLNLPAPVNDDEFSQVELSAVSDGEFVNP